VGGASHKPYWRALAAEPENRQGRHIIKTRTASRFSPGWATGSRAELVGSTAGRPCWMAQARHPGERAKHHHDAPATSRQGNQARTTGSI